MRFLSFLVISTAFAFCPGYSGSSYPSGNGVAAAGVSGINLALPGNLPPSVGQGAADRWNDNCSGAPCICLDGSGAVTVQVSFAQGSSLSGELGIYDTTAKSITLYSENSSGHTLTNEELTSVLTHEIGHALGLGDVSNSDCLMGPMRNRLLGGYHSKMVGNTDCNNVRDVWRSEMDPRGGDDCINQLKTAGDCNSPLVIDLARNGFRFGGPQNAVWFDLYGIDEPVHIQWLQPDTDDAFLVMDLNQNGIIDGGSELFGQGSIMWLEGGRAENGFAALAQYDHQSLLGNSDGVISAEDDVWQYLYLWNDRNADGVSSPNELEPIAQAGLGRFLLSPTVRHQTDPYGNKLKLWEKAFTGTHPPKPFWVVDVFFNSVD